MRAYTYVYVSERETPPPMTKRCFPLTYKFLFSSQLHLVLYRSLSHFLLSLSLDSPTPSPSHSLYSLPTFPSTPEMPSVWCMDGDTHTDKHTGVSPFLTEKHTGGKHSGSSRLINACYFRQAEVEEKYSPMLPTTAAR